MGVGLDWGLRREVAFRSQGQSGRPSYLRAFLSEGVERGMGTRAQNIVGRPKGCVEECSISEHFPSWLER